jgi:hypothetical protein
MTLLACQNNALVFILDGNGSLQRTTSVPSHAITTSAFMIVPQMSKHLFT